MIMKRRIGDVIKIRTVNLFPNFYANDDVALTDPCTVVSLCILFQEATISSPADRELHCNVWCFGYDILI